MNNFSYYLNLRLTKLVGLYVASFVGYTLIPADWVIVRQIVSYELLVLLVVTSATAISTLFPTRG